jgi:hypothetical protein
MIVNTHIDIREPSVVRMVVVAAQDDGIRVAWIIEKPGELAELLSVWPASADIRD